MYEDDSSSVFVNSHDRFLKIGMLLYIISNVYKSQQLSITYHRLTYVFAEDGYNNPIIERNLYGGRTIASHRLYHCHGK